MMVLCPNCRSRFQVEPPEGDALKLRCSHCRAVFRVVRKKGDAPVKVVIANESSTFCEAVCQLLAPEPFRLIVCHDGKETLEMVRRERPQLLLLDVALPTLLGFEVCEKVRQDPSLAGVRIVLIASIYDKTRYKRAPGSLYGADDYIEKHHIPDSLVPTLYRLLGEGGPRTCALPSGCSRAGLRGAEVAETSPVPGGELAEAQAKARRLARVIVSDILLYHEAKLERGVREGNAASLFAEELREGAFLFRQRAAEQLRDDLSYLDQAFLELIAMKRSELQV